MGGINPVPLVKIPANFCPVIQGKSRYFIFLNFEFHVHEILRRQGYGEFLPLRHNNQPASLYIKCVVFFLNLFHKQGNFTPFLLPVQKPLPQSQIQPVLFPRRLLMCFWPALYRTGTTHVPSRCRRVFSGCPPPHTALPLFHRPLI